MPDVQVELDPIGVRPGAGAGSIGARVIAEEKVDFSLTVRKSQEEVESSLGGRKLDHGLGRAPGSAAVAREPGRGFRDAIDGPGEASDECPVGKRGDERVFFELGYPGGLERASRLPL